MTARIRLETTPLLFVLMKVEPNKKRNRFLHLFQDTRGNDLIVRSKRDCRRLTDFVDGEDKAWLNGKPIPIVRVHQYRQLEPISGTKEPVS